MPFYYDLDRAITTNGSAGTESTHLWGTTVANQETVGISGLYIAARFGTAGGMQIRLKDNSGTVPPAAPHKRRGRATCAARRRRSRLGRTTPPPSPRARP
jgi:hypothetical protein